MEGILFSIITCGVLLWILLLDTGIEIVISTYFWAEYSHFLISHLPAIKQSRVFFFKNKYFYSFIS